MSNIKDLINNAAIAMGIGVTVGSKWPVSELELELGYSNDRSKQPQKWKNSGKRKMPKPR